MGDVFGWGGRGGLLLVLMVEPLGVGEEVGEGGLGGANWGDGRGRGEWKWGAGRRTGAGGIRVRVLGWRSGVGKRGRWGYGWIYWFVEYLRRDRRHPRLRPPISPRNLDHPLQLPPFSSVCLLEDYFCQNHE